MISKKEFIELYIQSYDATARRRMVTLEGQAGGLSKKLKSMKANVNKSHRIPKDFYAQTMRILAFALLYKDTEFEKRVKNFISLLASMDYDQCISKGYPEDFMRFFVQSPGFACKVFTITQKYEAYLQNSIERELYEKVQTDPTVEYIEARKMNRHFFLHIGPTNSGKTYDSIQRLKMAENGVYLSPLRLLALEIYDVCTQADVPCAMITGEEIIATPDPRVISQTIETVEMDEVYDIAVIDEAQMLADEFRGHSWVKALMGLKCEEIHVCASPDAEGILKQIIEKCEDTYEVFYHERKTPLVTEDECIYLKDKGMSEQIQKGDAFIVFSKKSVLDLAARFELQGIRASVIYGNLPPEIRKNEVRKFVEGKTDVVISTDAIGMGINLPIRRIIFAEVEKFDGKRRRFLTPTEVAQIAGRAGRYGIYEEGKVTAVGPKALKFIQSSLLTPLPVIEHARLDFPKVLLDIQDSLDHILTMWSDMPDVFPYKKIDTKEMLSLYQILKNRSNHFSQIPDGDDKRVLFSMISCPFDTGNRDILDLWVKYCKTYAADISLRFPRSSDIEGTELEKWETYYRELDLYHNFSLRMGKVINEEKLREKKDYADDKIMAILDESKHGFVKRCRYCGKIMPAGSNRGVCDDCFEGMYRRRRR